MTSLSDDSSLHTSYNPAHDYTQSMSPPTSPPATQHLSNNSTQSTQPFTSVTNNDNTTPLVTNNNNTSPYNNAHKPLYKQPMPWLIALLSAIAIAAIALAAYYGVQYHNQVQSYNSLVLATETKNNCLPTGECMVFSDEFNAANVNNSVWQHEFSMSGMQNGEFEMYTNSSDNTYIINDASGNGVLHIVPTFTVDWLNPASDCTQGTGNFSQDCEVNLYRLYGICTSGTTTDYGCARTSQGLTGGDVLNPIRSSRMNTYQSFGFKYGRMEVRAKLPVGDWLWPAIWLMPVSNKYGVWPQSGEIDVMESRGNAPGYSAGGYNAFTSTLHYGAGLNAYDQQTGKQYVSATDNTTLTNEFHIYGLKWTADELYTYIDDDANRIVSIDFTSTPIYSVGNFASQGVNSTGSNAAPFDSEFYVIFNLAVGGTNGYFPDNVTADNKPWLNSDQYTAYTEFWTNRTTGTNWGSTWNTTDDSTHLQIDYIRVYQ